MALLNVSGILTDPRFASSFDVERSVKATGDDGRTKTRTETFPGLVGSVQPADGTQLQRLPDGSNLQGAIAIFTRNRLTNGDRFTFIDADTVLWKGHRYTVLSIKDWTNYGAGHVEAVATLADNKAQTA